MWLVSSAFPSQERRSTLSGVFPDARHFLESARRDDEPLDAGCVLMLILGLRRGERLGLAWDDIDLASGEAHIAGSSRESRASSG